MIAICTPTRGMVHARFAFDLVSLTKRTSSVAFMIAEGTLLPNLRSMLVDQSLTMGASHVLFIDSDMRFPDDGLEKLLSHDVDIVGANCAQRGTRIPTARLNGKFIRGRGIVEVDTVGFGFTLIKASVFKKIPPPWFMQPFDGKRYVGEDVYFMTIAKEHGFKVHADNDVRIGHMSEMECYLE